MHRRKSSRTIITAAEDVLSEHLARLGVQHLRQIHIRPFVVDFMVPPNLVIEAEGLSHSHRQSKDFDRTEFLERLGYRVFRIPNYLIFSDPKGIAEMIRQQGRGRPCLSK